MNIEQLCGVAKETGLPERRAGAVERLRGAKETRADVRHRPDRHEPRAPFLLGFNNPAHWPRVMAATTLALIEAAAAGTPSVICFTGYSAFDPRIPRAANISLEKGAKNCVEGFKKMMNARGEEGGHLCLEMPEQREASHPIRAIPATRRDHTRLLHRHHQEGRLAADEAPVSTFTTSRSGRRVIPAHPPDPRVHRPRWHTAGNPGRGETRQPPGDHFPPIMEALIEVGYTGYVGHEFIPTRDPLQGLREAVTLCERVDFPRRGSGNSRYREPRPRWRAQIAGASRSDA